MTLKFLCVLGAGVLLCIEKALAQSGVDRADVNYVNAHATSTKAGDLQEYKALIKSFGVNSGVRRRLICPDLKSFNPCFFEPASFVDFDKR